MEGFTCLKKLFCLPCKGREGGEATEKAGKKKQPKFMTDMDLVKIAPKETD